MAAETVSIRMSRESLNEVDYISKLNKKKKAEILREIFNLGIKDKRLELALEKFRKKEATAAKASRIANIPLTEFFDVLKEQNLLFHYSKNEVEEEFKGLI